MKKLFSIFMILTTYFVVGQDFGEFASAIYLNNCGTSQFYNTTGAGANCINTTCATVFDGVNFGSFNQNSAGFSLRGGEIKSWKSGGGNVCSARLNYVVYPTGSRPGSPVFTVLNLPFKVNCCTGTFCDALGPCGGDDQKWSVESAGPINLTATAPGNYTIEIYYDYSGDFGGGTCGTTKYINNGGNPTNYTATFSIVASGGACALLPIEIANFKGKANSNFKEISWSTKSERNNDFFILEKSDQGTVWQSIGEIAGAGNSNLLLNYSFQDFDKTHKDAYYRLTQVDFDGKSRIFEPIFVSGNNAVNLISHPNPSTGTFSVFINSSSKNTDNILKIVDLSGAIIYCDAISSIKENDEIKVEKNLAKGVYFIILGNEETTWIKHVVH